MLGKNIQLTFSRGSKTQRPNFGLDLSGFSGGWEFRGRTMQGGGGVCCGTVALDTDWIAVNGVDIRVTIVEAVATGEWEEHGQEAIVACKTNATGEQGVFETFLIPAVEHIA